MVTKKKPVKLWDQDIGDDIPIVCAVAVILVILTLVLMSNTTFECTNYMECIP